MSDEEKQAEKYSGESTHGSGYTTRTLMVKLQGILVENFEKQLKEQSEHFAKKFGKLGFKKNQIEDMKSGFLSGMAAILHTLNDMEVIKIEEDSNG